MASSSMAEPICAQRMPLYILEPSVWNGPKGLHKPCLARVYPEELQVAKCLKKQILPISSIFLFTAVGAAAVLVVISLAWGLRASYASNKAEEVHLFFSCPNDGQWKCTPRPCFVLSALLACKHMVITFFHSSVDALTLRHMPDWRNR